MYKLLLSALLVTHFVVSFSQQKNTGADYGNTGKDQELVNKLNEWRDLKFGFFVHWGIYSQWGTVESWSLCNEDRDFIVENRPVEKYPNYDEYKVEYKDLQKTFNPTAFEPESWAELAEEAGMKYIVFTTKHHDGFSMFDTQETDYKVTSPNCPYHVNSNANITKSVFDSFRNKGFMIGAYFSKPDWNSENYWWPYFATPDRNVNYDVTKYPDRWNKFKSFTFNQINELMTGYGQIDILWLDGGWVRPDRNNQDIDIPGIASMARKNQPGLIIVDRGIKGPFTDYLTPEQHIPEEVIKQPWETCLTLGDSWSYKPNDNYKSSREIIHLLVDVVSKGGNLLLNVGPDATGNFDPIAKERLLEIGDWLKTNGESIYGSKLLSPHMLDDFRFSQGPNGEHYITYLVKKGSEVFPVLTIPEFKISAHSTVEILGHKGKVKWESANGNLLIQVDRKIEELIKKEPAIVIKVK